MDAAATVALAVKSPEDSSRIDTGKLSEENFKQALDSARVRYVVDLFATEIGKVGSCGR